MNEISRLKKKRKRVDKEGRKQKDNKKFKKQDNKKPSNKTDSIDLMSEGEILSSVLSSDSDTYLR